MYLTATRPDIMFAASLLSRFMHSPTKKHMGIAKRVLRYIQGTLSYGIEFTRDMNAVLIGFCDSDWAGSEDDSRSTSGYAFSFGSGVFSWASVKQNTVALSTAEAEYVSAAEATAQAIWLRFVLDDYVLHLQHLLLEHLISKMQQVVLPLLDVSLLLYHYILPQFLLYLIHFLLLMLN